MKHYYFLWCMLYVPCDILLAVKNEQKNTTPPSLKKICLQAIANNLTDYSAQKFKDLPTNLIISILKQPQVVSLLPNIKIPTAKCTAIGHIILRYKCHYLYPLENGTHIILKDIIPPHQDPNNNYYYYAGKHFYIQIYKDDKTLIKSLGQHNISPITCIDINKEETQCAIGRKDGTISLFDLKKYTLLVEIPMLNTSAKSLIYLGHHLMCFNELDETYILNTKALYKRTCIPDINLVGIWNMNEINIRQNFHILLLEKLMPRINSLALSEHYLNKSFPDNKLYILLYYAAIKQAIKKLIKSKLTDFIEPLISDFAILAIDNNISDDTILDLARQLGQGITLKNGNPIYRILLNTGIILKEDDPIYKILMKTRDF